MKSIGVRREVSDGGVQSGDRRAVMVWP
jgi:hypothetical protein